MAKLKVYYTEGYSMYIVKAPVEIDTDDYPELAGLSNDEIAKYITDNAIDMKSSTGDEPDRYSLYDECYEEDIVREKETGNEVHFKVEE